MEWKLQAMKFKKYSAWLPGTKKPGKHDAGWHFVADKSHGSAAFVFFTANKWKCNGVAVL
ncbi:MAG: hypothetical protein NT166_01490 [Candidatus Aminicenantes bacterium]|nr:hypothetical protein [Candidatus Aminicenantes bacterium]